MNTTELVSLLDGTFERLSKSKEELCELDSATGDGDLGITIAAGARAARAGLAGLDERATPAELLRTVGDAFANANPSTMGALLGAALRTAARTLDGERSMGRAQALLLARAAAESIATKGKCAVGDKTILDALVPSVDALRDAGDDSATALTEMVRAARDAIERTTSAVPRKGRAAWVGQRGVGHPDPGATAYLRLLESIAEEWRRAAALPGAHRRGDSDD